MANRRGRLRFAASGLVLAGALVAGCAGADRVAYYALVGEAPGDKPLYTGFSVSARLGRPEPPIADAVYRPPAMPDEPKTTAADRARQARQLLSDRASDFELRSRYLRLNASEFQAANAPLRPSVGKPLPPANQATAARFAAVRQAMARVQADVLILHGIVQRAEQAKAVAERVLAELPARGAGSELIPQLREGIARINKMLQAGDALVGAYVEWMAEQRTALDTLEEEIRRGGAAGPPLLQRETLIQ
jgi:hypothetical protein